MNAIGLFHELIGVQISESPHHWSVNPPYSIHVFLKYNLENSNLIWNSCKLVYPEVTVFMKII